MIKVKFKPATEFHKGNEIGVHMLFDDNRDIDDAFEAAERDMFPTIIFYYDNSRWETSLDRIKSNVNIYLNNSEYPSLKLVYNAPLSMYEILRLRVKSAHKKEQRQASVRAKQKVSA